MGVYMVYISTTSSCVLGHAVHAIVSQARDVIRGPLPNQNIHHDQNRRYIECKRMGNLSQF
jgi:hypothetical protein